MQLNIENVYIQLVDKFIDEIFFYKSIYKLHIIHIQKPHSIYFITF